MQVHDTHDGCHEHPQEHDRYHYPAHYGKYTHDCDDQLPVISKVGTGKTGDGYRVQKLETNTPPVEVGYFDTDHDKDGRHLIPSHFETYLKGEWLDASDMSITEDWESFNINGGQLFYQYNMNPHTSPSSFTLTFIYRRPKIMEENGEIKDGGWTFTTPAIPYIGETSDLIGSGVGTVWVKTDTDTPWEDFLVYPPGTTRDDYNAPAQGDTWSVNLKFGIGEGNIKIPNLDDLAKLLGVTKEHLYNFFTTNINLYPGVENIKKIVDVIQPPEKWIDPGKDFPKGFGSGDGETVWDRFDKNVYPMVSNLPPLLGLRIPLESASISLPNFRRTSTAFLSSTGICFNFGFDLFSLPSGDGSPAFAPPADKGTVYRLAEREVTAEWQPFWMAFGLPAAGDIRALIKAAFPQLPDAEVLERQQAIDAWWVKNIKARSRENNIIWGTADNVGNTNAPNPNPTSFGADILTEWRMENFGIGVTGTTRDNKIVGLGGNNLIGHNSIVKGVLLRDKRVTDDGPERGRMTFQCLYMF
jgi:hypothetical protein